jgi:hypothetical protein
MDVRETGCEVVNWINLAQNMVHWWAVVNTLTKFQVP